jgi:hypothetical protein
MIKIEIVNVGNPSRLIKTAIKQYEKTGDSGLIYHSKTGEIAKRDSQLVFTFEYWHYLTDFLYPIYEDGKYIGDSLDLF